MGIGMTERPTDELNELLAGTGPEHFDEYYRNNRQYLKETDREFNYYFKNVLEEKKIKLRDVYIHADVSESYGGQILRMEKHTASRDLIIRLCLGGHFSLLETNRALKLYGFSELYAKIPRDAMIIMAIHARRFDIHELNEGLIGNGMEGLI